MGVALEVMLVLVCQLYPNYSEFDILQKFFAVFAQWPWADDSTGIVIITGTVPLSALWSLVCRVTVVGADLHEVKRSESFDRFGPWSKDNPLHRKQAMKIITPCYPQANTTSKVLNLQLLAIKTELYRGWGLTQRIVESRGPNQGAVMAEVLDQLLSPFNFFDRYTHYAVIKATAETQVALYSLRILPEPRHFSSHFAAFSHITGFICFSQRRHRNLRRGRPPQPHPDDGGGEGYARGHSPSSAVVGARSQRMRRGCCICRR